MAKSTVTEMPPAESPKAAKSKRPGAADWPDHIPPVGDIETPSFQEWLATTKDEDWEKYLICYVWRCEPITDRKAGGGPSSIDTLTRKFDYKEILKLHGSGRYRFDVSYRPANGGKQTRVKQHYETIFNLDSPPRIAMGEWIDDPRNKDWTWAKPQLEAEEKRRVLAAAESINPSKPEPEKSEAAKLKETLDLVQALAPKDNNAALLIELLRQQDPTKVLGLAKEIASLNPPAQNQNSGESTSMMQMMMQFMISELKAARQAPAVDPLTTATTLITGVKGMMETLGGGVAAAAGKPDTTAVVVETLGGIFGKVVEGVGEHLPAILGVIQHAKTMDLQIAQVAASRNMNPTRPWEANGGGAPAPATFTPRTVQAQPAPQPQQPAPVEQPPVSEGPMTPILFAQKHRNILSRQINFIIDKYKNETGYDAQEHLIAREGQIAFNQIREDATPDLLLQLTQLDQNLKTIFSDEQKARTFFTELLSDPNEERPDEDDEDAAPLGGQANG